MLGLVDNALKLSSRVVIDILVYEASQDVLLEAISVLGLVTRKTNEVWVYLVIGDGVGELVNPFGFINDTSFLALPLKAGKVLFGLIPLKTKTSLNAVGTLAWDIVDDGVVLM